MIGQANAQANEQAIARENGQAVEQAAGQANEQAIMQATTRPIRQAGARWSAVDRTVARHVPDRACERGRGRTAAGPSFLLS